MSTHLRHFRSLLSVPRNPNISFKWTAHYIPRVGGSTGKAVFLVNVFASWIVQQLRHKTGAQPSARIRHGVLLAMVKHLKAFSQGQFCLHPLLRPFLLLKTSAVQTDCMCSSPRFRINRETNSFLLPLSPHSYPSEDSNHSSQASWFSSHLLN